MEIIIGNKKSKKSLLILSGVHGNEYVPCIVSNNIKNNDEIIDFLKKEYNSITFFNIINKEGLRNGTREHTVIDLNRMYQYDLSLISKLKVLIDSSTHILDLHSSPHCGNFILINNTDTANSYVEYAIKNNIKYLIYNQFSTYTIKHQSQLLNKISITFEMNGIDYINYNNVISAEIEVLKILKSLHTIKIIKQCPTYKSQANITAIEDGIYYVNDKKQLVCLTLDNTEHIYNIVLDNDYIATYPIKSFYKKNELVLLVQEHNQLK